MNNFYQTLYAQMDESTRIATTEMMDQGIAWALIVFAAAMVPLIIGVGVQLALGNLSMGRLWSYVGRVILVLFLLGGGYVTFVRESATETIPAEIAGRFYGGGAALNTARQFDAADASSANFTANALLQTTGISNIGNRIAIWFARMLHKMFIAVMYAVYTVVKNLTYFTTALLPFLLPAFVFENTRNIVFRFWGVIVGLIIWQVASSAYMFVALRGMEVHLANTVRAGTSMSIDQQIDQCFGIAANFLVWCIGLIVMPAVLGGAGGAVGGAIMGSMTSTAMSMTRSVKALERAVRALSRK